MPEEETGATETATTETKPATTETTAATETDASKELEKWKSLARKNEDKAKANASAAKELEKLQASAMSDTEKAVAAAREEGKAEAAKAAGSRLAAAEIKAALTGVVPDPASVVEDLDLTKYLSDDGEVDAEKVLALAAKFASFTAAVPPPPPPGVPKGAREGSELKQLFSTQGMSPAQIVEARKAGQFAEWMSGKTA